MEAGRTSGVSTTGGPAQDDRAVVLRGVEMLRRVFPLLTSLKQSGTQRDKAGNRKLLFNHYAALVLVGLFNPVLNSARALTAASGLRKVKRLTGGSKVSTGSFSEAACVFEPELLEGVMKSLLTDVQRQKTRRFASGSLEAIPDDIVHRLVAVDGSVLTALPQVFGRLGSVHKGQWRLHAQVRVYDRTCQQFELTDEPSIGESAERRVVARSLERALSETSPNESQLFLMDRGYRSADLFNRLKDAGHDYICRLNRHDGKPVGSEAGQPEIRLPPLSDEARAAGIVADELITLGGGSGASPIGSRHAIRRITVVPVEGQPSTARQGRVRKDRSDRDELTLATTLLDLPAEQIVLLYRCRWQVELFFRFLKHVLKCQTLLTASTPGVQIQIYCTLIASLLLALITGHTTSRRTFEMISLFFSGWAEEDELLDHLRQIKNKPP